MEKEEYLALVVPLQRKLLLLARSLLGNWAEAEDALQEALLNAYVARNELRNQAAFSTWLRTILVHECTRVRHRRLDVVDPQSLAELRGREDDHSRLTLLSLVDRLPTQLGQVVALRYLEDMSQADVAAALRIPVGTVKSRLNRALTLLRADLEGGESSVVLFGQTESAGLS